MSTNAAQLVQAARARIREIAAPELPAWRGQGAVLVDVREPAEFVGPLGHLPGAELVPLGSLAARALAWAPTTPLLLVCRTGARSAEAAATLVGMGFRQVYNLAGGMLVWNENRLPVVR